MEPMPSGLPRRRVASDAPAPTAAPATVGTPTAFVGPATADVPAPTAAPATVETPTAFVGPATADPSAPSEGPSSLTRAGLARRTPLAARAQAPAPVAATRSASRTSRSPDEVRRMLSRYRSGLDRGRTTPSDESAQSSTEPDVPDSPTRGAQE
jgi:hypothetical protein